MRQAQLKPDLPTYNALKLGGMVFFYVFVECTLRVLEDHLSFRKSSPALGSREQNRSQICVAQPWPRVKEPRRAWRHVPYGR